mgnify:CR=1 FL=1
MSEHLNKVYLEDCIKTMNDLPEGIVDLTVTSPPYDDAREYNNLIKGMETDYNGYSFPFEEIAQGLYRVTKKGGILVWVVGDMVHNGGETLNSFRQALYFQSLGFKMHDTMIYEKNGSSFPARRDGNRYSQIFEYMFVFSKDRKPNTANLICDKKNKWAGWQPWGSNNESTMRTKDGKLKKRTQKPTPDYSPRNNVWRYNTGAGYTTKDKYAFKHPAMFPEKLVEDHILSWTKEGDVVYDPMAGAGTTPKMAVLHNRNWIATEISEEYVEIIHKRIQDVQSKLFSV